MAEKQALNATFFAFNKRERSGVLFRATAAYLVILFVVFGGFVVLNLAAVMDYLNWVGSMQATDAAYPQELAMPPASVMAIGPMYFLFQILFYIIVASYEAACLRWMIHGETSGFFGLSLGADTWRVYFTYWLWFFLFMAFCLVFFVLIGIAGAGLGFSAASQTADPNQLGSAVLAMMVGFLLSLLALVYFSVRFAPAAATSIAKRRFAFFDAWTVTKGRFWALLGSFAILILMFIVGYVVFSTIATFAIIGGMMGHVRDVGAEATPEQMYALFANPAVLVPLGLVMVLGAIGMIVWTIALYGVNARAAQAALQEGKIQVAS